MGRVAGLPFQNPIYSTRRWYITLTLLSHYYLFLSPLFLSQSLGSLSLLISQHSIAKTSSPSSICKSPSPNCKSPPSPIVDMQILGLGLIFSNFLSSFESLESSNLLSSLSIFVCILYLRATGVWFCKFVCQYRFVLSNLWNLYKVWFLICVFQSKSDLAIVYLSLIRLNLWFFTVSGKSAILQPDRIRLVLGRAQTRTGQTHGHLYSRTWYITSSNYYTWHPSHSYVIEILHAIVSRLYILPFLNFSYLSIN